MDVFIHLFFIGKRIGAGLCQNLDIVLGIVSVSGTETGEVGYAQGGNGLLCAICPILDVIVVFHL